MLRISSKLLSVAVFTLMLGSQAQAGYPFVKLAGGHGPHLKNGAEDKDCFADEVLCAKTVTTAFAPDGRLWRLWAANKNMYFAISNDNGKHFGPTQKVSIDREKIYAKGENRPKIAFGADNTVYLSWSKKLRKRRASVVRFTYSIDGGKTFAKPITVNSDSKKVGHAYNELLVDKQGNVNISWLDERHKGRKKDGSSLYTAQGRLTDKGFVFVDKKLADDTCVCCRIATDLTAQDEVAVMWRSIYDNNIRDHAIMTFKGDNAPAQPFRATFDQWYINGCPHQGPGLDVDKTNRYHMVWFNNGEKGKGVFYGYSDNGGKTQDKVHQMGNVNTQASFAHVLANGTVVDVVWMQFDGDNYQLYHKRSNNNGQTFGQANLLSVSSVDPDNPFLVGHNGKHFVSWQRPGLGHQVFAL